MGIEMICPTIAARTTTAKRISTGRQLFLTNWNHSLIFSLGVRTTLSSAGLTDSTKTLTAYTMHSKAIKL